MSELLTKLIEVQIPFNMLIIAVLLGCGVAVVAIVAQQVRLFATHRMELDAKREMLQQGLSVDEVERVLKVTADYPEKKA